MRNPASILLFAATAVSSAFTTPILGVMTQRNIMVETAERPIAHLFRMPMLDRIVMDVIDMPFHVDFVTDLMLLAKTCAKVRSVLFLPRAVLLTMLVPDRRHFPASRWNQSSGSARHCCLARHG